jgi:hypothetical protein
LGRHDLRALRCFRNHREAITAPATTAPETSLEPPRLATTNPATYAETATIKSVVANSKHELRKDGF